MASRSDRNKKGKKTKSKKLLQVLSIILVILILGAGGYAFHIYSSVKDAAGKMHENLTFNHLKPEPTLSNGKDSVNILLLGVDTTPGDHGRSDTMIVLTLNPRTKSMQMVSIPRDTRTEIVGRGTIDKINAAYAYGNEKMAVETVQKFTNINIDYFIKVNEQGLSALVDAVGGVTVDNPLTWADTGAYIKGYVYKKGPIFLNGPKSLGYVRMRKFDPRGDFGRNERQRQVIQAIVDKGKNFTTVTKINNILDAIGSNVKTNLTFDDMKSLATKYRDCKNNITSYEVKGQNETINGIYYLGVSDSERQKVHDMIKNADNAN